MKKILNIAIFTTLLLCSAPILHAQFPGMPKVNRDSLDRLTNDNQEHMMKALGLTGLRPGRDGYSTDPAIGANYDESIANVSVSYPDPLVTADGRKVKNARMWNSVRRPELLKLFEDEVYGHIPDNVPGVNWKVVKEEKVMTGTVPCISRRLEGVVDNSSCPEISVTIQAEVVWPESATGAVPVIVEYGFMLGGLPFNIPGAPVRKDWKEQVVERGWAAATIVPTSYQADGGHGLRQGIIGLCNKGGYRKPGDWGSIRAWGWGLSRLIDYFESDPRFDGSKVAIEGNSRYGKTALVSAVFDERVASAFVSSSGEGGASPWRRNIGETLENLAGAGESHWMCGNFIKYAADPLSPSDLPVDQHELIALMAPRPVLISSGTYGADKWQDLLGMYICTLMASPVYELLGAGGITPGMYPGENINLYPGTNVGRMKGRLAFRQHDGGHEPGPNWPYFLDHFDKFVVNKK